MEKVYNLREASGYLGVTVRTLRYWAQIGSIKAKKIAGTRRWIITETELKRLQNAE